VVVEVGDFERGDGDGLAVRQPVDDAVGGDDGTSTSVPVG